MGEEFGRVVDGEETLERFPAYSTPSTQSHSNNVKESDCVGGVGRKEEALKVTDHVLGTSSLIPDSRAELFLYGLAYESARPGVKGMLLAPKDRSVVSSLTPSCPPHTPSHLHTSSPLQTEERQL